MTNSASVGRTRAHIEQLLDVAEYDVTKNYADRQEGG